MSLCPPSHKQCLTTGFAHLELNYKRPGFFLWRIHGSVSIEGRQVEAIPDLYVCVRARVIMYHFIVFLCEYENV